VTRDAPGTQRAKIAASAAASAPVVQAGTCMALAYPGQVAVNMNGALVTMNAVGTMPLVGDTVMVLQVGLTLVCLGSVGRPAHGTVTGAAAGNRVPVRGDDGVAYSLNYLHTYTPTVNDVVVIGWDVPGGVVLGPLNAPPVSDPNAPNGNSPGNPENSGPTTHSQTFNPTDSGTYQGSWFDTRVWCSANTVGAYFYGGQLAGTIPDDATIISVEVYIEELENDFPSSLATIGMMTLTSKSGVPVPALAVSVSAGSGWKSLPTSFGDSFKNGGQNGLATSHGGEHIWGARGTGNSGALKIVWSA
jgi:hypothetical protein